MSDNCLSPFRTCTPSHSSGIDPSIPSSVALVILPLGGFITDFDLFVVVIDLVSVPMSPGTIAGVMKTANPVDTSIMHIDLGFGAWLGGVGIASGYGLRSPFWVGAILAVLWLVKVLPNLRSTRSPVV